MKVFSSFIKSQVKLRVSFSCWTQNKTKQSLTSIVGTKKYYESIQWLFFSQHSTVFLPLCSSEEIKSNWFGTMMSKWWHVNDVIIANDDFSFFGELSLLIVPTKQLSTLFMQYRLKMKDFKVCFGLDLQTISVLNTAFCLTLFNCFYET